MGKRISIEKVGEDTDIFSGSQFTFATFGEADTFFVILETAPDGEDRPVKMIPTTWIKEINFDYGDE